MEIVFVILGKFTVSHISLYSHKIIDLETSKLVCPWILGILIVFQFFPIVTNIF